MAAVQLAAEGRPERMRLSSVLGFHKWTLAAWARRHPALGMTVPPDGLGRFWSITEAVCRHQPRVLRPDLDEHHARERQAVAGRHLPFCGRQAPARYLAEFRYRFNHRFDLRSSRPRLAYVAAPTLPMPYRFLALAEVRG